MFPPRSLTVLTAFDRPRPGALAPVHPTAAFSFEGWRPAGLIPARPCARTAPPRFRRVARRVAGSVGRAVALIVIGTCVVGLVDNFLRPALVSGRTQLNGLLVFVSLLGGVAAFGLIGLVIGPVMMATAIGLLEAYAAERRDNDRTFRKGAAGAGTVE